MPQAPDELRVRWGSDCAAFSQLGNRFDISRGGIITPRPLVAPSEADLSAIDYLCLEWDYGYEPGPELQPAAVFEVRQGK